MTKANTTSTITINDKEIKAIDAALVGVGSLLDLIISHKDDIKVFHTNKLMPVLWGRAFGVAEGIINQRGKLTQELLTIGQLIGAGKAQFDKALLERVKLNARARASQLYKDARAIDATVSHPNGNPSKASHTKVNKAHKGGDDAPKTESKPAKAKVEKPKFETIKDSSDFIKRLIDNRKITDLNFPANNYGLCAPKLAALLQKQYKELEAFVESMKA